MTFGEYTSTGLAWLLTKPTRSAVMLGWMDDHLLQCTGLDEYSIDDIASRYWEAWCHTTKNSSTGGYDGPTWSITSKLCAPLHVRTGKLCSRQAVTDRSVTSRTVAQHIESVTHHSVSARTIQRRLQQSGLSARRPLLGLPLTQNHKRLRRQWCESRRMWVAEWNEVVFTDESRICLQHHDGWIRVWRHRGERMLNSGVMHRHTGPVPGIMGWDGIGYPSRTPLVRIDGTLSSQRYISEVLVPVVIPYIQGLTIAIFQQDNARPHVARIVQRFFVNHQIKLLPWQARSLDLSPIENMWPMVAQRLTQLPHQINFHNVWKLLGLLYPKNTSKVCLNQCRSVWQR
ncbi:transposable element Tcb1 transposase [Trichonephila clavipes]|uniref:Transposable element Tcb1 transposase n=1 Tax=Trichonephila clavipes TaxID=2585209 RepID=A0A8X6RB23_TRICX|nr:transposable element Tcb1 transposase [Trichonephila clavipes]